MDFEEWFSKCNELLEREYGMSVNDLEDWRWRDSYDSGDTPRQALSEFKEYVGLDF